MDFENTLLTAEMLGDAADTAADAAVDSAAGDTTKTDTGSPVIIMQGDSSPSVQQSTTLDPPTLASSGLPAVVRSVFGDYHQRTQTTTTVADDGSTTASIEPVHGLAGLDWYWLTGVFLFTVVLWSFFRFLGVVFKR